MKKVLSVLAVSLLVGPWVSNPVSVGAATFDDGMPGQANVDKVASSNDWAGLWGDAAGGVAGRPYVKTLNVINGSVSTPVITNGTATTPESTTAGAITAVIQPTNLCKTGQTTNNGGQCYSSPNRLGFGLGYVKSSGQLGYNFSNPTTSNGSPLTLAATVNADTVIELVLNMNTWGTNLRWTWMNGAPQYWKIDGLGTAAAEITMRVKITTGPSQACQSAIPVMPCDPADAVRNNGGRPYAPEKILRFDSVLSLDSTGVPESFNGSLFASSNADIGSLVAAPSATPALNYGIVGPSEMAGAPNLATFSAFVSDASLLNYFGVTSDVVATEDFKNSALAITRADGGTGAAPAWARWDAATYGTDGWFLTVSDISFNGAAVNSQGVSGSALTTSQPARLTVKQKVAAKVAAKRKGTLATLTFRATASACAKASCRVVVQKISGTLTATSTKVKTAAVVRKSKAVSLTVSAKVPAKQSLAILLQTKKAGKWVYVSSKVVAP
ncbi:MAG: hypothetical protein RL383_1358 [Actinomycetota bacterium]|jgi:hypothetical protein